MKKEFQLSDRREFLAEGLRSAALLTALAVGRSQAADRPVPSNPFAYDVSRQSKTDPKLIAYEEVARWKSPHPEPKRLAVAPDQRIFVCSGNYITALDSAGQSGLEIALPDAARCVAVAKDGSLFVTEDGNGTIWRVTHQKPAAAR